ncbi:MAG: OprD family outer membrane porin [Campylobacterales bacterium]|nr:OprD family outer membrane porin [Campylobacterales bacterium]
MKLGKLSLVAVMALGTSAFAIDNVKVNGEAKVWYQTSEFMNDNRDMFDHDTNSLANTSLMLGATMDLAPSLSMGASAYALSTLGLENNLVGDVPSNKVDAGTGVPSGAKVVDDQAWMRELWLAYTVGKTTAKIGRQELNTPLAFTEKWNVVDNTFDAIVLLNNDLPDTTLVGAWVGKHNGIAQTGSSTVNHNGTFETFGPSGAYAFAAVNKSIPNTTVQAWYYNVLDAADAYWLQADAKVMDMVTLGAQFANMDPKAAGTEDTSIWAVKAAVDVAGVNLYGAYSSADDSATVVNFSNVSTGDKSMIYTALGSIYMDGEFTTRSGTDAWKIGASTKMVPGVTLSASYGESETDNAPTSLKDERNAWDVVASGKVGPVGLTGIYTNYQIENAAGTKTTDTDTLRIIASLKF